MHTIQENPILRNSLLATLCLGGSYLIGRKFKNFSSLALNTGAVLAVSIGAEEQRVPIRLFLLVATTLATTYGTKASFVKKYFTPLKVSHAFAHSAAIGGAHALTHHFFPSKATLARRGDAHYQAGNKLLHEDHLIKPTRVSGTSQEAEASFRRAIQVYQDGDASDEKLAHAQHHLGITLLSQSKWPMAELALNHAVESYRAAEISDESFAYAQYHLGIALLSESKWPAAETALNRAIEIFAAPSIELQEYLAMALFKQSKWGGAEHSFEKVIVLYQNRNIPSLGLGKAQWFLGKALFHQNKWAEAEKACKDAITAYKEAGRSDAYVLGGFITNPFAYIRFDLGMALRQQGKWGEAEAVLLQSFDRYQESGILNNHSQDTEYALGETFIHLRKWQEAEAIFRKIHKDQIHGTTSPKLRYVDVEHYLGLALLRQGKWQQADVTLTHACINYHASGISDIWYVTTLFLAGQASLKLENWEEAEALKDVVKACEDQGISGHMPYEARYYLGIAFFKQGKWPEAQSILNEGITKGLKEPLLANANKILETIETKLEEA